MPLRDTIRTEYAIARYDAWLELRGTPRRRRRELRTELRSNLQDAATEVGTDTALLGIGSPRRLANDMAPVPDPTRGRWTLGGTWALLTLAALVIALLLTSFAFLDGVDASGVRDREVSGGVFPWFGTTFSASVAGDGSGIAAGVLTPWPLLVFPLLVFAAVAQPWRPAWRVLRGQPRSGAGVAV